MRQLVTLVHICVGLATWPFRVHSCTRSKKAEPPRELVGVFSERVELAHPPLTPAQPRLEPQTADGLLRC